MTTVFSTHAGEEEFGPPLREVSEESCGWPSPTRSTRESSIQVSTSVHSPPSVLVSTDGRHGQVLSQRGTPKRGVPPDGSLAPAPIQGRVQHAASLGARCDHRSARRQHTRCRLPRSARGASLVVLIPLVRPNRGSRLGRRTVASPRCPSRHRSLPSKRAFSKGSGTASSGTSMSVSWPTWCDQPSITPCPGHLFGEQGAGAATVLHHQGVTRSLTEGPSRVDASRRAPP